MSLLARSFCALLVALYERGSGAASRGCLRVTMRSAEAYPGERLGDSATVGQTVAAGATLYVLNRFWLLVDMNDEGELPAGVA